ncbi:hypothetical protein LshimejAT787_0901680 [Lyophyllum shimeji]|uniref:Uncharacterized protein n=1 Tax=Lyophyllum shimeji TaxID=47721 RepID=A0A9P3PSU9_LYOSH|nr:hypothetical protein LshimejAT787_0901680 [Lyophyllum shimeji]
MPLLQFSQSKIIVSALMMRLIYKTYHYTRSEETGQMLFLKPPSLLAMAFLCGRPSDNDGRLDMDQKTLAWTIRAACGWRYPCSSTCSPGFIPYPRIVVYPNSSETDCHTIAVISRGHSSYIPKHPTGSLIRWRINLSFRSSFDRRAPSALGDRRDLRRLISPPLGSRSPPSFGNT